ncbi:MAG: TetR family transcriptional regulator [Candidatus Nanopelagicales bacterium]
MKSNSRELVLDAARRLFAERGYPSVTIRQIAAEAGLSASMVMKVGGSKAKLYEDAAPTDPEPLDPATPQDQVGAALATRILARRATESSEPWVQSIFRTADAPNPKASREEFHEWAVTHLSKFLPADAQRERKVELLACLILGLAVGLRTQRLLESTNDAWIISTYGRLMQQVIDGDAEPGSS